MDTAHQRMEIIIILSARGHTTMRELAWELDVSRCTIMNDIIALSFDYPVYTKPGGVGGVFITENYKPYTNTELTNEKNCRFVLWVGNKRLIKRRLFDQYIEQEYSI